MGEHDGTTEAGEGAKGTRYVVLVGTSIGEASQDGRWFVVRDEVVARSAEAAIAGLSDDRLAEFGFKAGREGALVAVPARSWRPVRVRVETVTRRTVVG